MATALVGALLVTVPGSGATPGLRADAPPITTPSTRRSPTSAALPNPPIQDKCGLDVTLVLDASGSISSSNAVDDVRGAAKAFLDALSSTSSRPGHAVRHRVGGARPARPSLDNASLAPGGALADALTGYYNPTPPHRPAGRFPSVRRIRQPAERENWGTGTRTEPVHQLGPERSTTPDHAGRPRGVRHRRRSDGVRPHQTGDPFERPSSDVIVNTNGATRADASRSPGDRRGQRRQAGRQPPHPGGRHRQHVSNPASVTRLTQVVRAPGRARRRPRRHHSLNQVDVALVTRLRRTRPVPASVGAGAVLAIAHHPQAGRDRSTNDTYVPAPGWNMRVTPSALRTGTGFRWILPVGVPGPSATVGHDITDANGFAQFQWEPTARRGELTGRRPRDAGGRATTAGRPAPTTSRGEFRKTRRQRAEIGR